MTALRIFETLATTDGATGTVYELDIGITENLVVSVGLHVDTGCALLNHG